MSPRRQTARVAAPVAGPFLQAFIEAHRADPWTTGNAWEDQRARIGRWQSGRSGYEVRAGAFYDLYVEQAEETGMRSWTGGIRRVGDPDEPLLSHRDFGLVLQSQGFEPDRDEEGRFYSGLTMPTREERAEGDAWLAVAGPVYAEAWAAIAAEHAATVDHGVTTLYEAWDSRRMYPMEHPARCSHNLQTGANVEAVNGSVTSYLADHGADVARVREERFGPYLRWRVGDPEPAPIDG